MAASTAPDLTPITQQTAAAQSAAVNAASTTPADSVDNTRLEETGQFDTLEVDTGSDKDSAFDEDYRSFTTSITSTATNFKFENGYRYHAYSEDKYMLPNDNKEIQRLELQHMIWQSSMHEKLILAPISPNVRTALDIGCGTGAWAIEFAEQHPNCRVMGIDLSPIQPTMVPQNLEFIVDDMTSPWIYDHKFDYIHSRAITVGIKDWSFLVDQIWQNLAPGGWIEFQEYHAPLQCNDSTMDEFGPNFAKWNHEMADGAIKAGTRLDAILSVPPLLEKRGFVNVQTAGTKWPLGRWPKGRRNKRTGELFAKDLEENLEAVSMRLFTKVLGWAPEDVSALTSAASQEIASGKMHVFMPIDFLYAQKPQN